MKKLLLNSCLGLAVLCCPFSCVSAWAKTVVIALCYSNPDYAVSSKVFEEGLTKEFKIRKSALEVIHIDTNGDKELFIAKIKEFEPKADLFFVAGTPNAVLLKEAGITKPVLFTAVADPVSAKLVDKLDKPGGNFTGNHCAVPEDRQLTMLLLVAPKTQKIGLLYTPGDIAAASQIEAWKNAIKAKNKEYVEIPIPDSVSSEEEMAATAKAAAGKVDVIVTVAENKVSQLGAGVIAAAKDMHIPYYSSLLQLVEKGALAGLGFDFSATAKLSVTQARSILNGASCASMAVITFPKYRFLINAATAKALGIVIRSDVKSAAEIIE